MLVVRLGVIEAFERRDLGDDFSGEDVGGIELGDVGLCDAALLVAGIEDRRAVGGADVGALAVELSGIVGDGEEDAEELAVGDLRGIVDHLDGFGVAGGFGADLVVGGGGGRAAGVANRGGEYAFYTLEDRLRAPETASGEDRGGFAGFGRQREVGGGGGDGGSCSGAAAGCESGGEGEGEESVAQDGHGSSGAVWLVASIRGMLETEDRLQIAGDRWRVTDDKLQITVCTNACAGLWKMLKQLVGC